MSLLICADCATSVDPDQDEAIHCECGGKLIAHSIYLARRDAELDRIDQMWDHAEPTYQIGFMTRRQAGGVK